MVLGTADEARRAWVSPVYGEFERALSECGLKLIHHGVLTALDDLGPLSQQPLADSLDFDKSHLVGHIDHLENHGLVKRGRNPSDRRRNQAVITAALQALLGELRPVQRSSRQGFLDGPSPDEQRTLESLLRRVLAANDSARLAVDQIAPSPNRGEDDQGLGR
jgi:DNA-binding MarR family transcriptional regulator